MADQADQEVPLLDDLLSVAHGLTASQIPHEQDVAPLLGALVLHLESEGATVSDDIRPQDPVPPGPAVPGATDAQSADVTSLFDRARAAVEALEQKAGITQADTATQQEAAGTPPPAEPDPSPAVTPPPTDSTPL